MVWRGEWGDWMGLASCTPGNYVTSMRVKYEDNQRDGDDTALNGLEIRCRNPEDWYQEETREVYSGIWGDWKDWSEET